MSWTSIFPVLTDEMVKEYQSESSGEERRELDSCFAVERVVNPAPYKRHVVSFSLFWKNPRQSDPDLPPLDRKTLKHAGRRGLVTRYEPWYHYVKPLLDAASELLPKLPEVTFRVYLAKDLEFLVKDLIRAGCEVRLMKGSSIRHNPGAMWRFLALEDKDRLVTFCDSDKAPMVGPDILRTEETKNAGLGFWRVPVWGDVASDGTVPYRPMFGGQFGTCANLPMRRLMKAFVWHHRRGSISSVCRLPGCGERSITGAVWPDYGFDEYFLTAAVYPRLARRGVITFLPSDARSQFVPFDIEYVTWANPRSEVVYFATNGCCGSTRDLMPQDESEGALTRLEDFSFLETEALTQRHSLPDWAPRSNLSRNDLNGEVWAWFNPASIKWRGKRWLAYRTECSPLWHWSRTNLAQLDDQFKVIPGTNKVLDLPTNFSNWGAEDPRFTLIGDRLLLSYSNGLHIGLAELNEEGSVHRASLFSETPLVSGVASSKDRREKNWGFFAREGQLYASYWVAPHVVFACDPSKLKFTNRWETPWNPPGSIGLLHGGSSPTLHDGLFWRVVHSAPEFSPGLRRYRLWLMAFDPAPPFAPRWFCNKPLLIAEPEKLPAPEQIHHEVVFCSSIERTDEGWLVFFGENDRRIRYGIVPDTLITPHLQRVH